MIPYSWLVEAAARLAAHIIETPLEYDLEHDLYLKWENHQLTGSFKGRGAFNKILTLQPWELQRGLVAASAGNHGQGVALAGRQVGAPVIVFASEHAVPAKVAAMRQLGADVRLVPGGYGEAEKAGLAFAAESEATWISAYNDGQIIAGQGTLGLEILNQLAQSPTPPERGLTWIIPIGGGGLCAGIACALYGRDLLKPGPHRLVAVQSEASPFFHAIYHQGDQAGQVELASLADGLAGPVEEKSVTIPILRRYLDDFVLVDEADIQEAIRYAWQRYGERIEGSAAASLAAVLTGVVTQRPALVVITGGNIQPEMHQQICDTDRTKDQQGNRH
jgi:threonine dehydratase